MDISRLKVEPHIFMCSMCDCVAPLSLKILLCMFLRNVAHKKSSGKKKKKKATSYVIYCRLIAFDLHEYASERKSDF